MHFNIFSDKRYTCVHLACLPSPNHTPTYFPTWTALQHHNRTIHPPACSYPSCQGRTFSSQKGLRAHQKLHEQHNLEKEMGAGVISEGDDVPDVEPGLKRRRGGEFGRDWKCNEDGCEKDFKSVRRPLVVTAFNFDILRRKGHCRLTQTSRILDDVTTFVRTKPANVHLAIATFYNAISPESICLQHRTLSFCLIRQLMDYRLPIKQTSQVPLTD